MERLMWTLAKRSGWGLVVVLLSEVGGGMAALAQPLNPEIEVGIVQRFGQAQDDRLRLTPDPGHTLTLRFPDHDQDKQITTQGVTLDAPYANQSPQLEERVVLSTHRSFESAEDSALDWQRRGIPVEVAQPGTWEVWAKRSVYNSPVVRHLLVADLQTKGFQDVHLSQTVATQKPQAAWVVNGYRYHRDHLQVTSDGGVIRVNDVPYPGTLHLQPNSYGTYTLVNRVTIEDYLQGVVPYEIGPAAPQAAVEAQAILARTYALRNLRRFALDDYQLCADTQCQVYRGWLNPVERVNRAIAQTRGLVLTYQNTLVDAVYSSTTGGVTAAFEDVWNGEPRPYLQPVVDALPGRWDLNLNPLSDEGNLRSFLTQGEGFNENDRDWRYFRWQTQNTLPELAAQLHHYLKPRKHPLADFQHLRGLRVEQRARGGRVQRLLVSTDQGDLYLEKDQIIQALEAPNSLLFYLNPVQNEAGQLTGYTFVGGGLGHGVGLSQAGSYHLANLGWSSDRILGFYYPQTHLKPLDSTIVFWPDPTP